LGNIKASREILGFFRDRGVGGRSPITNSIANGELCKRNNRPAFGHRGGCSDLPSGASSRVLDQIIGIDCTRMIACAFRRRAM
jgi:hypothetical protein